MISQVRSEAFFADALHDNNHEDVDILESELLNDFLFRSEDNRNSDSRINVENDREMSSNDDEEAIFNTFINTDTLDTAATSSNGLYFQSRNSKAHPTQGQPPFNNELAMSSTHLEEENSKDTDSKDSSNSPPSLINSSGYGKECQDIVDNSLIFGRSEAIHTPYVNPLDYINVDESTLPYKLSISGLPGVSRVENQIKLDLKVSPPLKQCMVHLPPDCIARQKFYLEKDITSYPEEFQDQLLYVEAFLLCASNNRTTYVCTRCVKREHRRASRRKSGLSDNMLWCNNENRRAIIFNNKQVFVIKESDERDRFKKFDLTARIVCYCRHHKSPDGFKILFVLKNSKGDLLAKSISTSIMIMDKKPTSNSLDSPIIMQNASNTDSGVDTATEVFSSEVPTATSISDHNANGDIGLTPGKYFDMTEMSPIEDASNNAVHLTIPNGPMPSPTSMSEEGSESHVSERRNDNQSTVPAAAIARTENYQRKRSRHDALPENNLLPRSSWSSSSLANPVSGSASQIINQSSQILRTIPDFSPAINPNQPSIQRVIPAQGPINGGIEITLLGSKFKEGLLVKFGENVALSTQCWSETTMVTYLPPASCAGQVYVTVIDSEDNTAIEIHPSNKAIFTYVDDTDRQLIELALQIVGLKMNGKLEDARNIAKRIVGNDDGTSSMSSPNISPTSRSGSTQNSMDSQLMYSDEILLVKVIRSLHVNSNLSMCDSLGRTLLHLASLKGYHSLASILIKNGARLDDKDLYGFTALHFACVGGDARLIRLLLQCKADPTIIACNEMTAKQLFIANHSKRGELNNYTTEVTKFFDEVAVQDDANTFSRKFSDSSFHSSVFENESLYSADGKSVPMGLSGSGEYYDSSEYEGSDLEENGDESLLTGDEPEQDTALEVEDHTKGGDSSDGKTSSMDSSLLNRMLHYLNDDLPKYEDLFPGSHINDKNKAQAVTMESYEDMHRTSSAVDDSQTSSEDEEDALQLRFNRFFQQRQNFKNDKMLLFFWLPLTIVLLSWYILFKFGQENDNVHYLTNIISEYLRVVLAKILLGNERMKTTFKEQLSIFQSTGILNDFIVA